MGYTNQADDWEVTAPSISLPKDGDHVARFVRWENLGKQQTKFGEKDQLRLIFVLDNGDQEQWHTVNKTLHPSGKLFEAVASLIGGNPPMKFGARDLDGLKGTCCIMRTQQYVNDSGKTRVRVALFPMRRTVPAQPMPQQQPFNQPYTAPNNGPITDDDIPF